MGKKPKTDEVVAELMDQLAGLHGVVTQLAERERQIDAFFNLSRDIFMIVEERTGSIIRVNPRFEEVLGWPVDSVVGRAFSDFVHPEDAKRSVERLQQIVGENRGDESTFVNHYRTKDGRTVELDWRSSPPAGGLIYAVARVIDAS